MSEVLDEYFLFHCEVKPFATHNPDFFWNLTDLITLRECSSIPIATQMPSLGEVLEFWVGGLNFTLFPL